MSGSMSSDMVRPMPIRPRALPFSWGAMAAMAVMLAACGTSRSTDHVPTGEGGSYKIGKPYQVAGVWYYPHEDENYDSTGIGSWYGPQFHGKSTANGETFDQEALTAAHPTLPMPVLVRVTNLENGRSLVVRVNDRGPFVNGREIDLSRKAAELLGYDRKGTARVRVQYVGRAPLPGIPGTMKTQIASATGQETFIAPKPAMDESEKQVSGVSKSTVTTNELAPVNGVKVAAATPVSSAPVGVSSSTLAAPKPAPAMQPVSDETQVADVLPPTPAAVQHVPVPTGTNLFVQAGSFRNFANAESVHQQLLAQGFSDVQVQPVRVEGTQYYRVRVGPLPSVSAADASLQTVIQKGHAGARIIVD
ncbi:septal ring lytic transglycosylase RlpA family protein [Parvibaculum sp.]|uniref:septal ring lytic transglycosylase RlpA family protein n=1 Tax=Parvibaculum sp. TaxID=2024848 RepID=UPI00320F2D1C